MNAQRPGIQYLDYTWNPIKMLCTPVSAGCDDCWHREVVKRFNYKYDYDKPILDEKELQAPLKRKTPSRIGVQFMGDLFHEDVTNFMIDSVFTVMTQLAPQHTYLILTKRIKRIQKGYWQSAWKNIHLGVSVEDQATADERIPILLNIPAAVRWVSLEPLLGPVDIMRYLPNPRRHEKCEKGLPTFEAMLGILCDYLDWVVIGAESGKNRRPCKIEWIEDIVRQCEEAGTPVFVKQSHNENGKLVKMPEILGKVRDQLPPKGQAEVK